MSNKTIVVTGTSSGFGKAIVEEFAVHGWNVAASVRSPAQHSELFAHFPNVRLFALDVSDENSVAQFAADVLASYQRIDVLVNNAGQFVMGPLETHSLERIRSLYEVNLFGPLLVTRAFLPRLREQGGGMIVNMVSSSAKAISPFLGAYGSSKWAAAGLSEALALELAPLGIKVKTLFPGVHATDIFKKGDPVEIASEHAGAAASYRPFLENVLALQRGVRLVRDARHVARLVFRIATKNNSRVEYVVGPDAVAMALVRRLVPRQLFHRLMLSGLLRPPSPLLLRALNLVMRGTVPVQVNWGKSASHLAGNEQVEA